MQLYNSLTGRKEPFEPADPGRVTMYVCGPTVWNFPHIGNARPAVVFDVLYRLLSRRYPNVIYARNVTDVEDKIIKAARDEGVAPEAIVARYTLAYHADMNALGVLPPTIEPFATGHMPQMVALIARLIGQGHAYEAEGHVLFHVPSYPGYGALSHRSREEMIDGARVEVAPYKRDPADFVLWKPSAPEQPGWDSPWGRGRPGWHIECSAMVEAHLGVTIDIHGGGQDLKFPHHENELAQSACAHGGAPLARFWLHNGFVDIEKEKMSKSLGNVVLVRDLLPEGDEVARVSRGEDIRYALLSAHYRKPLDWSEAGLARAKDALDRLYLTLRNLPALTESSRDTPPEGVVAALEDDLNTPKAFAELRALARRANASADQGQRQELNGQLLAGGALLGLLQQAPETRLKGRSTFVGKPAIAAAPAAPGTLIAAVGDLQSSPSTLQAKLTTDPARHEVDRLVEARTAARKARNFTEADRIRDQLAAQGVILEDRPDGTTDWRLAG